MGIEKLEELEGYMKDDESRYNFMEKYIQDFIVDGDQIMTDDLCAIYSDICEYFACDCPSDSDIQQARSDLDELQGGKAESISLDTFKYKFSKIFLKAVKNINNN